MKNWESTKIILKTGERADAVAPVIISASRSTDIPAFYSQWFFNRLREGYLKWKNPFNGAAQYVSFKKARLIVFWSKNPAPILDYLDLLDNLNINYYFQYTLNNYEAEGLETHVPPLKARLETFLDLSEKIGKEKVIWRFDPIILTESITIDCVLDKIEYIGESLHKHTDKLVISFADIAEYRYVASNLAFNGIKSINITKEQMIKIAQKIQNLSQKWGLEVATCTESIDLETYNIAHNRCIDDELIVRLFKHDNELMDFIGYSASQQLSFLQPQSASYSILKDRGQRKACGCIKSKDIGIYNTCGHCCLYCYANRTPTQAKSNMSRHNPDAESIL